MDGWNFEQVFKDRIEQQHWTWLEAWNFCTKMFWAWCLMQTIPNTFLMVGHTMKQNSPRYPTNFTNQNHNCNPSISSRFHFQSNQGSASSREPYKNTQSGLSNSNGGRRKNVPFTLSWERTKPLWFKLLYILRFWDFLPQGKS